MSIAKRIGLALAVVGSMATLSSRTMAGPAISISDTTSDNFLGQPPFTLGFEFQTLQAITVTQLGVFDDSLDGLAISYPVGIFDSIGSLLVSSTVDSGTTDPLIGAFRFAAITPITLAAGQSYRIGALYATDDDAVLFPGDASDFVTVPAIVFVGPRAVAGDTLSDPVAGRRTGPGYFGPNFIISPTATAVPEPATIASLGLGLIVGAGALIRRKRSA